VPPSCPSSRLVFPVITNEIVWPGPLEFDMTKLDYVLTYAYVHVSDKRVRKETNFFWTSYVWKPASSKSRFE